MAKLSSIKKAKRAKPFGAPSAEDDGRFQILIPEGAATGVIPNGDQYIGRLSRLIKNTSKKGKGNPQWVFTWTLVTPKKFRGMTFDWYCPLVNNSLWKLQDTCTALGVKVTKKKDGNLEVDFDRSDVMNTLVRLGIREEKGTGDFRDASKVFKVLPHPDGAGKKGKGGFIEDVKGPSDEELENEDEAEEDLEETDEDTDEEETDEDEEEGDEEDEEGDEEDDEEGDEEDDEEEADDEADDDEESDEEDDEEESKPLDWHLGEEKAGKKARKGARAGAESARPGRPRVKADPEYATVDVKRRRGPKVEEKPVKRGRPAGKKSARR